MPLPWRGKYDVHDSVDARELSEENHYVGVDDRAASAGDCDEIEPSQGAGARFFVVELVQHGVLHDEELLAVFGELGATNTLPDIESLERMAFVHEEAWRLGHEKHSDEHYGRED